MMRAGTQLSPVFMFKRRKRSGKAGENPLASRVVRGDDRPTQPLQEEAPARSDGPGDRRPSSDSTRPLPTASPDRFRHAEEPATRLVTPPDADDDVTRTMDELPVAALLVIRGPGRGALLAVGPGTSKLGRGASTRIRLDFGDTTIASDCHAVLVHDPERRRFTLQPGGGADTSFVDGHPVKASIELRDGARLRLGETELLFRTLFDVHGDDSPAT
jgi:hypothetical protein